MRDFMAIYDRQGKRIGMDEYVQLHVDMDYKRVAEDTIGPYWISTVWLGMDHGWARNGPPIIFETMVFADTTSDSPLGPATDYLNRYATEEEAVKGHEEICTVIRATINEDVPSEEHHDTEH